ncbi:unnamed protein product [Rotaria sordida]|uniref:G-protein coupled receptors family 1 profile domain-containing protein n=1 Tax=Rotaria sordida TaxID=392033 RepID=A0A818ZP42_9BILA|nr:unnamed protein product [Rotaria sordida]
MSTDSEHHRPSFRFRDKFSRFKDKVKEKVKDKAIKHNITLIVHQNLTSNDTDDHYTTHSSRHGFRQHMHHMKDVLKNKTHYSEIKDKIKHKIDDKFDLHDNKTYPKGFYDSLFSPETENDVYLQTALTCLWVIALLCIIPTIIIIFLPSRKKRTATSTNMIFFHIFLCEIFYLSYVLLAIINVAKDFRLGPFLCDFANYGMYVTIPIMQFALLFLSLERLQTHFKLSMTWTKIFTKPFLIQVILCAIWIILIALVATFMFIKKQFSFNFFKDKIHSLAPPIVGDVVERMVARRHHCSIDGRLSSVFKTVIIILFIILIVKPIIFSLGFNLLTPYCCKKKRKDLEKHGDRRTTTLVTIFLLLNLFFSFPFYIVSMFNTILTRIDSTKDTFTLILKICFTLRITNIIFECLAFYIFERNSWNLLRKLLYYGTCKKCSIFNASPDDDVMYTKDPDVQDLINRTRLPSDDDDDNNKEKMKKKRRTKKEPEPITESEPDDDDDDGGFRKPSRKKSKFEKAKTPDESDNDDDNDDGAFRKSNRKKPKFEKVKTPDESDNDDNNEETVIKPKPNSSKKIIESEEEEEEEEDEDEKTIPKTKIIKRQTSSTKKVESDDDEPKQITTKNRKSKIKQPESDNDEDNEPKHITITKRSSRTRKPVSNDDDDDRDQRYQTTTIPKRKSRPRIQEETTIEHPKTKSTKSHRNDVEIQIPNGRSTSHRPSSVTKKSTQRHSTSTDHHNTKHHSRQRSPSLNESEADRASDASHTSSKMIKTSASSKPIIKQTTKPHSSSKEHKQIRSRSPNQSHSRYRTESSPSSPQRRAKPTKSTKSHHTTRKHSHSASTKTNIHTKKPKIDRRTRILEMSDEV